MVVAIVAVVFLAPVLVIALILWYRMRKARMLNETMLKLAERGVVTSADALEALAGGKQAAVVAAAAAAAPLYEQAKQIRRRAAWSDLRKGVFIGGVGLALTLYSLLDDREPNALGLVLLFVGIGFVVLWWFEERQLAPATGGAATRDRRRWALRAHRPAARRRRERCAALAPEPGRPRSRAPMAEPPLTDAQLIARVVVHDDRHAFSELVRRHQSAVRATLRRLTAGNHALADDLAQETFMLAYRNLKSFRQEAQFSTWLYRIATNAFLADARKRKEELLGDRDQDVGPDEGDDAPGRHRGAARPHARRNAAARHGSRAERPVRRRACGDRPVLP